MAMDSGTTRDGSLDEFTDRIRNPFDEASEEGYAAYASLQVAITLVSADLEKLIDNVRELVGEVNFSYDTTFSSFPSEEH